MLVMREFDFLIDILEDKLDQIQEGTMADEPPLLYITLTNKFGDIVNRPRRFTGEELVEYKPNFREAIAVSKPYKGTRKQDKPLHFYNLFAYIISEYDVILCNGIEADDQMMIDHQAALDTTVICSRDKDLFQELGTYFGWECGKQPQRDMFTCDDIGFIENTPKGLKGYGRKFFYAQMLVGDKVDNIPGLPGAGPAAAVKLLVDCEDDVSCFKAVKQAYKGKGFGKDYFFEQADLLWMIREKTDKGYKLYSPPNSKKERWLT